MTTDRSIARLNRLPLAAFPALFATLAAPDPADLAGSLAAAFTGPRWLRRIAPPGLGLVHLRGWWGKEIGPEGRGANLVRGQGGLQRVLPFRVTVADSRLDARPCAVVRYDATCPFPWPHILDELRWLDAGRLLGMTIADAAGLRRLPLPFILTLEERTRGL